MKYFHITVHRPSHLPLFLDLPALPVLSAGTQEVRSLFMLEKPSNGWVVGAQE